MDPMLPTGTNRCQCPSCKAYFGGVSAFDMHRVGVAGDRRCICPSEVRDKHGNRLLWLNERGYWGRAYVEEVV